MQHWLLKSEPGAFSIQDLRRAGRTGWDGVRNYQARNNLRAMKAGDKAFFYHSSTDPAVVGIMEIAREAHPDPTQFDPKNIHYDPDSPAEAPRWLQVEVKFVEAFDRPLPLEEIREHPALKNMVLLKHGRLSVQPVTPTEWAAVCKLCASRPAGGRK